MGKKSRIKVARRSPVFELRRDPDGGAWVRLDGRIIGSAPPPGGPLKPGQIHRAELMEQVRQLRQTDARFGSPDYVLDIGRDEQGEIVGMRLVRIR